jgi:hypothetical protein
LEAPGIAVASPQPVEEYSPISRHQRSSGEKK